MEQLILLLLFIMGKYIYLNNSATGWPKPSPVVEAVNSYLEHPPCHHLRGGDLARSDIVSDCRKQLAELFNVEDSERIIFTSGATESLNLVIRGLELTNKNVVTTATEHNSVLRPLKTLEKEGGITLTIIECDLEGKVIIENLIRRLKPDTGLVVMNHCSNVTGALNDIKPIGRECKKRNIPFLVDASQSAGVYPIDVQDMYIDALAFTGHKALHGLPGIGGVYINEGLEPGPLKTGGTGIKSDYLYQPEKMPLYYEAGTLNMPGIISLYHGVKYIFNYGIEYFRKRKEEIVSGIKDSLKKSERIECYPEDNVGFNPTLFSFNISGIDPEDVGYLLSEQYKIIVRSGLHCAPLIHRFIGTAPSGCVRVSPSHFTTGDEVESLCRALLEISEMGG